ncbi:uncharacterized [Tachysurus ichikawai]
MRLVRRSSHCQENTQPRPLETQLQQFAPGWLFLCVGEHSILTSDPRAQDKGFNLTMFTGVIRCCVSSSDSLRSL